MALYLVQHGAALSRQDDPERGLSAEGEKKVRLIGEVAANYGVNVEGIFHSGRKRALQTAELLAQALNPQKGCTARDDIGPMDDVASFATGLRNGSNLMFVGHLPFMEKLVSELVTGSAEYTPFKFQNGGIVCLDREEGEKYWYVKWALMPDIS